MKNVLHHLRKNTQLGSSFIGNQISNHANFKPHIVYKENRDQEAEKGYASFEFDQVEQLDLSESANSFARLLSKISHTLSTRQLKKVIGFIEKNQIGILHFHYGSDCGVYYPLLHHVKIPSVVSFYGYDAFSFPKKFFGFGRRYLKNRVFDQVGRVLAMTEEMRKDLIRAGCPEEKLFIHYHGVPSGVFRGHKSCYEPVSQKFTLMMLSSFDPVKGHIFILQALKELRARGITDIQLKIAGSGFYGSVVEKFVIEHALEEQVFFLGRLEYGSPAMLAEIANTDVFVHPSVITREDKEGIPGAIVEAMFAGLPVLSTFHGGIPYVIKNGKTGMLIKEWDVEALSNAIVTLKNDQSLRQRLGKAGQDYALNHLSLEKRQQSLEDHYFNLIEQSGKHN